MEFSTQKSVLLKELERAQGVVERKATIPILSNILVETVDSGLRISATDLELGMRSQCPANVKTPGAGAVPAKRLLEIVRALPDGPEVEVKFKALENHWVQITCERSSFKLVGMAQDTFPVLAEPAKPIAAIPAQAFATLIDRTIFAISSEETRYTLNGALLVLKPESVTMVATDGHRLALVERKLEVSGLSNELRVLIPRKAMGGLRPLLSDAKDDTLVEFSKDETHLFFTVGDRLLLSRMLSGQFPNYEAVLPRDNKKFVELDRELLTSAIRRVALLSDERSHSIRLQVDAGRLEIFCQSAEYGEANEALDAQYAGDPMQIGFNYQYLLDFLGVLGSISKVRLELKDEQSAGQLRPIDEDTYQYRYVVMPMRI